MDCCILFGLLLLFKNVLVDFNLDCLVIDLFWVVCLMILEFVTDCFMFMVLVVCCTGLCLCVVITTDCGGLLEWCLFIYIIIVLWYYILLLLVFVCSNLIVWLCGFVVLLFGLCCSLHMWLLEFVFWLKFAFGLFDCFCWFWVCAVCVFMNVSVFGLRFVPEDVSGLLRDCGGSWLFLFEFEFSCVCLS